MSFSLHACDLVWPSEKQRVIQQRHFERDHTSGGRHAYIAELSISGEGVETLRGRLRFTDEDYLGVPGETDAEKSSAILHALQAFVTSEGLADGFYVDVVTDDDGVHLFPR